MKDYRTFQEWSSAGYKILKGSKASWIGNVAMFSRNQVVYSPRTGYRGMGYAHNSRTPFYDDYSDWDSPLEDWARDMTWGRD